MGDQVDQYRAECDLQLMMESGAYRAAPKPVPPRMMLKEAFEHCRDINVPEEVRVLVAKNRILAATSAGQEPTTDDVMLVYGRTHIDPHVSEIEALKRTIATVTEQRDIALARLDVLNGTACADNRAAGRGGCGLCGWCCHDLRDRNWKLETENIRLKQERDDSDALASHHMRKTARLLREVDALKMAAAKRST